MTREKDRNAFVWLRMLRELVTHYRSAGATHISVDDLEQAIDAVEAKRRGR